VKPIAKSPLQPALLKLQDKPDTTLSAYPRSYIRRRTYAVERKFSFRTTGLSPLLKGEVRKSYAGIFFLEAGAMALFRCCAASGSVLRLLLYGLSFVL